MSMVPVLSRPDPGTALPPTDAPRRWWRTRRTGHVTVAVTAGLLVALLIASFVVPAVAGFSPTDQDLSRALLPPSASHPFGTDALGRDVFLRCLYAARVDLAIAAAATALSALLGITLGLIAGMAPPWLDALILRAADVMQALPIYVLLLVVGFLLGPGAGAFIVASLLVVWVSYARIVRTQVLVLRELDFVHAARLTGVGRVRVLGRHLLPNAIPQAIVYCAADIAFGIVALSSLSFLGLGIAAPTPEWGLMIQDGRLYLDQAWWLTVFPGAMIALAAGAFAFMGDALDRQVRQ